MKLPKHPMRYTGYLYEGICSAAARKWLKRIMSKTSRRAAKAALAEDAK